VGFGRGTKEEQLWIATDTYKNAEGKEGAGLPHWNSTGRVKISINIEG